MVTRSRHCRAWSAMWPTTGGQREPQKGLEQERDRISTGTEEPVGAEKSKTGALEAKEEAKGREDKARAGAEAMRVGMGVWAEQIPEP